eukprot:scaffold32684_cov33-Tisochrysis_lutea.AAC.1
MGNVWQGDGGQGGTAASGVGLAAASAALWLQQGALAQGWTAPQALSCGSECPSIALAGLLPGAPGHLGDALQSLRAGALLAGAHGCAAAGDAPRPVGELPNIKGGSAAQSGGEVAGGGGEDQHSQAAATHALSFLLSSQFPATPAQDPPAFTLVPPLPTTNPDAPDPAPVLGAHAPAVVLQPPLNHHHQQQQQQHQHAQEQHQHQEQLQGTGQGGHTGGALESSVDAVTLVAQWMVSHSIQQPQQQPQQQQQQQQPHHQQGQQEEGQRLCLDTALKWLPQQQQQQPQPHSPQQQHHRFNHQHHHSLAQQPHGLKQEQEGQQASKQQCGLCGHERNCADSLVYHDEIDASHEFKKAVWTASCILLRVVPPQLTELLTNIDFSRQKGYKQGGKSSSKKYDPQDENKKVE